MKTPTIFVAMRRVRLNQGGYDGMGCYYGIGEPVYSWSCEVPDNDRYEHLSGDIRGRTRHEAATKIRAYMARHTNAKLRFYRETDQ